jgi:hypothetical protein
MANVEVGYPQAGAHPQKVVRIGTGRDADAQA